MAVSSADSAMRALDTRRQSFVAAVRAGDGIALRPGEEIDDQADEAGEKHQKHPQDAAVHASGFGVAGDPYQQGDIEDDNQDQEAEDAAAGGATCRVLGVAASRGVLGENG